MDHCCVESLRFAIVHSFATSAPGFSAAVFMSSICMSLWMKPSSKRK